MNVCRFNPLDERCGMELDDINPDKWAALEAATDEYIVREDAAFDDAARALCSRLASGTAFDPSQERLGEFCSVPRRAVPGRREGAWESGLAAMMLASDWSDGHLSIHWQCDESGSLQPLTDGVADDESC